jgi:CheY-like chemotaxis protein
MPPTEGPGTFILLVHDDPQAGDHLARLLRAEGHAVRTVPDGRGALGCLDSDPTPDLILLDHAPPAARRSEVDRQHLRDPRLAAVPVVVLSEGDAAARGGDSLGAADYLPKPVDPRRLLEVVGRLTRPRRPVVLIVDDEPAVGLMLDRALHSYGLHTHLADSGPAATEVFRRHRQDIDVVLLDVQMAGTDGPQTLAALRQIDPAVPAVFMSGDTGRYTTQQLRALGADVVEKPFPSLASLADLLRQRARR